MNHAHGNGSFHSAAMGAISWLRTGNLIIDMLIAMTVPLLFRYIFEGQGKQAIMNAWHFMLSMLRSQSNRHECTRTISHSLNRYNNGMETRNEMLQKALAMYLTEVVKISFKGKAQVALTALHDARFQYDRPDKYNPLANYRLTWLAPEGEWVDMDREEGIEFRQYNVSKDGDTDNNGNSSKTKEVVYELRCTGNKGAACAKIDALISRAVEWYKAELKKQRDDARYFYSMTVVEKFSISNTDKDDDGPKYKRYKLSDHKRFDSLFFPEKDALLTLLDDFQHKRGKYAVSGFPHKCGVMLHGPPGTGKTSLIKALAHATNRSIVSIPLGQIKTNQQLMDVMYDLKLSVAGCETPSLEFKDVIFVIEDVDAASKIVLRRDGKASFGADEPEISADGLRSLAAAAARAQSPKEGDEGPKAAGPKPALEDMMEAFIRPAPDALNLAGLLNVLDGVVDTPGRLLILTSNHPDKLDPALIRPGRVDRLIHLDYMKPAAAADMITHYFGGEPLLARQRARLDELLGAIRAVTPAVLEQLCARHATVDDLLDDLAAQVAERAAMHESLDGIKEPAVGTAAVTSVAVEDVMSASDSSEDAIVVPPVAFPKRQTSGGVSGG